MKILARMLLARLSEKSTWISIVGFSSLMGFGLNPEIAEVATVNLPVVISSIWAGVQILTGDKEPKTDESW